MGHRSVRETKNRLHGIRHPIAIPIRRQLPTRAQPVKRTLRQRHRRGRGGRGRIDRRPEIRPDLRAMGHDELAHRQIIPRQVRRRRGDRSPGIQRKDAKAKKNRRRIRSRPGHRPGRKRIGKRMVRAAQIQLRCQENRRHRSPRRHRQTLPHRHHRAIGRTKPHGRMGKTIGRPRPQPHAGKRRHHREQRKTLQPGREAMLRDLVKGSIKHRPKSRSQIVPIARSHRKPTAPAPRLRSHKQTAVQRPGTARRETGRPLKNPRFVGSDHLSLQSRGHRLAAGRMTIHHQPKQNAHDKPMKPPLLFQQNGGGSGGGTKIGTHNRKAAAGNFSPRPCSLIALCGQPVK